MASECPFCDPDPERIFYRDSLVVGLWDAYPVSPGHALIVPVRHLATWFDASIEERHALIRAIDTACQEIESNYGAEGYNFGINSGAAAGQTVFHLHLHVIPRRAGDVEDPRGGVRHVIPSKANYLLNNAPMSGRIQEARTSSLALFTGGHEAPLLPQLKANLTHCAEADIAVAFTLRSGIELLTPHFQELLDRGGRLRILTGDYLGATDPDALLRLLDLHGAAECRIFQTNAALGGTAFQGAFHPKAYIFGNSDGSGSAFVGSSNLSASALAGGIEWNYRIHESRNREGWEEIRSAFESLFASPYTAPLTHDWITSYRNSRRAPLGAATHAVIADAPPEVPKPHAIQAQALAALAETRKAGKTAGLVVLATGLGKTWLSAFDSMDFRRVLFIAHREEILDQALATFRAIRPNDSFGRYTGGEKSQTAAVLFASIQTMSRQPHLERFAKGDFDYIVVDEFHHAEARTYRRLLSYFSPKFLLGLTATPERTDGADLLGFCENNLVFRCDVAEGIRKQLLSPFRYFGVPDVVNYRNIPWRNKRFEEEALTTAVATLARAENALDQYKKRAGKRTLAFCVSQKHADFMASYLNDHGVTAKAVHSGPSSASRVQSLEALRDGSLAVMCVVDMFNEGVDVPELDTVLMLRPTESRIIWLQQFGRGLRRSSSDKVLTVIDYIGNHRVFMVKPQALFGLPSGDREVLNLLERLEKGTEDLPPGCEVTYELEAKEILRSLLRTGGSAVDLLTRRYIDFRESLGVRPTAVELFREGFNPRAMRTEFGSWLAFVKAQDGLGGGGVQAYDETSAFLNGLEATPMARSYKMLVLLAMLNQGRLPGMIGVEELAEGILEIANRDARVLADLGEAVTSTARLVRLLEENPINAWVEGKGTGDVAYFAFDGLHFRSLFDVSQIAVESFQELVRELVDWRLAEYHGRSTQDGQTNFVLKVSHSDGKPLLFLPDRDSHARIPEGWTDVCVGAETISVNFAKIAINVARRPGSDENILPGVLRKWFGSDVGKPGTRHQVMLRSDGLAWALVPVLASAAGATPYKAYRRAEVAPLYQLPYSERFWGQGFLRQGEHTFLFVTLDKSAHDQAFQYKDHFISANRFQWQSQNRTTRASASGRSIEAHASQGIAVHLFVRSRSKTPDGRGAPFYYCGPVEFVSWTGDKPITVIWNLSVPVPAILWPELGVPSAKAPEL